MRYFLVTYARKPGGQIDEVIEVSKKVKPRDIQMCNVIMDYKEKKVDKCLIEGKTVDTTWERMDEYYSNIYPSIIQRLKTEAEKK